MNNIELIELFYRRRIVHKMLKEAGNKLTITQLQRYNNWGATTIWQTLKLVKPLNLFVRININKRDRALQLTPKGERVLAALNNLEAELVK
jgi:predicted transcriptional regulator